MNRRYEYDRYVQENQERLTKVHLESLARRSQRAVRTRPRDPVERELLDRLAIDNWRRAIETGELEILGPRRFRLHV